MLRSWPRVYLLVDYIQELGSSKIHVIIKNAMALVRISFFSLKQCLTLLMVGVENANATVLTNNAKATGHILARLALDGKKLIPKWDAAPSNVTSAHIASNEILWGFEEGARHTGCGGHGDE